MSAEAMAIAFNHSKATGTALVILLRIASMDGDGGAWPAMSTLARTANVDVRTAQKAVRKLEQLGEIKVLIQQGGLVGWDDNKRPNRYIFKLACPTNCDRTKFHRTRKDQSVMLDIEAVSDLSTGGVTSVPPGDVSATPRVTSVPPKLNPLSLNRVNKETHVLKRARARIGEPCEHGLIHKPNQAGKCSECLAPLWCSRGHPILDQRGECFECPPPSPTEPALSLEEKQNADQPM